MKKLGILVSAFILLSAFTCENEPLEGEFPDPNETACITAAQNTASAASDFTNATADNFSELCNAYRTALQSQIVNCGDDSGTLQQVIDGLGNCTDDNEPTGIEGTWKLTAWNGTEPIDLNNDGTESINFLDEMDCYNNETLVFDSNNTGIGMSTSFAEFEIEIEIGTTNSFDYTVTCIDEIENTNLTWSQSANTVTTTDAFGSNDWTLIGNTLSILIPDGFTVVNEDDITISTIQDLTFVYTKQ